MRTVTDGHTVRGMQTAKVPALHGAGKTLTLGVTGNVNHLAEIGVRADHLQVLLGALAVAHVAGHLLVLEDPARILALTGGTMRTVTDGHTVRGMQTAKVPALHGAGKTLTLGVTGNVNHLA